MRAGRRAYQIVPVVVVTVRFYSMYKTRVGARGVLFNDHKIHKQSIREFYFLYVCGFFPAGTLSDRFLCLYIIVKQFVCSRYIVHIIYLSLKIIGYQFCIGASKFTSARFRIY
jgi:hypothetical protein